MITGCFGLGDGHFEPVFMGRLSFLVYHFWLGY